MVKHEHATGEYNSRRAECEAGVQALQKARSGIRSLRDVTAAELEKHRDLLSPVIYQRCRHVITENDRVQQAADALERENVQEFGGLMFESHRSLRDDYQVSCRELDILVEAAAPLKGVYGARMTGGGFGGCTINLVQTEHVQEFRESISRGYEAETGIHPQIFVSKASQGAEALTK